MARPKSIRSLRDIRTREMDGKTYQDREISREKKEAKKEKEIECRIALCYYFRKANNCYETIVLVLLSRTILKLLENLRPLFVWSWRVNAVSSTLELICGRSTQSRTTGRRRSYRGAVEVAARARTDISVRISIPVAGRLWVTSRQQLLVWTVKYLRTDRNIVYFASIDVSTWVRT